MANERLGGTPTFLTGFIGRERETAAVARLLGQRRLVTLTGVGGVGKTRLAIEVVARLSDEYPRGVLFVELGSIGNPDQVPHTVAAALGVREVPHLPVAESIASSPGSAGAWTAFRWLSSSSRPPSRCCPWTTSWRAWSRRRCHSTVERACQVSWEFIKFLTNTPSTIYFAQATGYMVVRTDAAGQPEYQKYLQANPNVRVTIDQMQHVRQQDSIAEVPQGTVTIEKAMLPVGSEGLLFHPYLSGERCPYWDPHLRASFVGAAAGHTSGHFARAVYEGTAYSILDALSVLDRLPLQGSLRRGEAAAYTVVGGGTASSVWLQIVADVPGCALEVPAEVDSSYGAALIGLVGVGLSPSLEEAAGLAKARSTRVVPDPRAAAHYADEFTRYRAVHDALAPLYRAATS
jgi:hypothetical protein